MEKKGVQKKWKKRYGSLRQNELTVKETRAYFQTVVHDNSMYKPDQKAQLTIKNTETKNHQYPIFFLIQHTRQIYWCLVTDGIESYVMRRLILPTESPENYGGWYI